MKMSPVPKAGDAVHEGFKFPPEHSMQAASAGFLLGLIFDPEDRRGMFLRNSGPSPNYMVLQPRRPIYVYKSLAMKNIIIFYRYKGAS
jgi:hypothetical protein